MCDFAVKMHWFGTCFNLLLYVCVKHLMFAKNQKGKQIVLKNTMKLCFINTLIHML